MAAYVIAWIEVADWDKFREYQEDVPRTISSHGGRYLARGGEMIVFEGGNQPKRVVVLESPSLQKARERYLSRDYQQLEELRLRASTGTIVAVEGC